MSLTTLVVVCSITKATFNIEFVAFVDILLHDFGQSAPKYDIMPIGTLWNLCAVR